MKRIARILKWVCWFAAVAVFGFVAGALAFYIYTVRSGPSLQLWHTERLTEEFTRDKADEIRSFTDYRHLEDKLLGQLDKQVYDRTGTGPEFRLARYSTGSAADPRKWESNWNRSFELSVDDAKGGVLLLHGMSDSPYSLRAIGEALHERGYSVLGLRLPGHGTVPSALKSILWEDMAAAVRLAMLHLADQVDPKSIHVVGYSTGAPLALQFTMESLDDDDLPVPASLVLISPAIGITPAAALATWKGRLAHVPGLEKLAWSQVLPEFDPFRYNSFAINAGEQVHRLTRYVARNIRTRARSARIEGFPPSLVLLSTVDATVSTDSVVQNLLEHLAPDHHELVLFDVNRCSVKSSVLVSDPGPLTAQLIADGSLPFRLTVITNESTTRLSVVSQSKAPFSTQMTSVPLPLAWPRRVMSLSHVALPFPPDDPLYGTPRPGDDQGLYLGQIGIQGERGLIKIPADWFLRLRHNPFYDYLESRVLDWIDDAGDKSTADK